MSHTMTILVPITVTVHGPEDSTIPSFHESYADLSDYPDHEVKEVTSSMANRAVFHVLTHDTSTNGGYRAAINTQKAIEAVLSNWEAIVHNEGLALIDLTPGTKGL